MVERKNVNNTMHVNNNFARNRHLRQILCEYLRTVHAQILVESGPERVCFRGGNKGYDYPVVMEGRRGMVERKSSKQKVEWKVIKVYLGI